MSLEMACMVVYIYDVRLLYLFFGHGYQRMLPTLYTVCQHSKLITLT